MTLVDDLRRYAEICLTHTPLGQAFTQAANRIEQLESQVFALEADIRWNERRQAEQ